MREHGINLVSMEFLNKKIILRIKIQCYAIILLIMLPGARGIFGAISGKISDKYDVPPIYVEWIGIFIFWVLYLIFNPDRFSSFDVYFLIGIYILSIFIYLITGTLKEVFKKPSIANKEFSDSIELIRKNYIKSQKKKKRKK